MGCYDTVYVPCPKCKTDVDFQSKGGDCLMRNYYLSKGDEVPVDVASDVNRHAPNECPNCGTIFSVKVTTYTVKRDFECAELSANEIS